MNCNRVQSQLAALSAAELPSAECAALEAHCAACPPCRQEWEALQNTLLLLSTLSQPLPSKDVSAHIWSVCSEQWYVRVEERRTAPASFWDATLNWARMQPRWGWAALGGAIIIFGSVWMTSPNGTNNGPATMAEAPADGGPVLVLGPSQDAPNTLNSARVHFSPPPATAAAAVNYHSQMSFDPFVDHVGSSLVSSSAAPGAPSR
jgi:hypothetical protein